MLSTQLCGLVSLQLDEQLSSFIPSHPYRLSLQWMSGVV